MQIIQFVVLFQEKEMSESLSWTPLKSVVISTHDTQQQKNENFKIAENNEEFIMFCSSTGLRLQDLRSTDYF